MQVNSLGSLLYPMQQDQLVAFHKDKSERGFTKQPQDEFMTTYQTRCHQASEDAQELSKLRVTTAEIIGKINDIVQEAKTVFKNSALSRTHADVDDQNFRVSGLSEREMTLSLEDCPMCNHTATGGITYSIQNLRTQEEIKIRNIALHCLEHDYFGNPNHEYRINIDNVCKVLELGPYKNS